MNEEDAADGAALLHRIPVLAALKEEHLSRGDLQERLDISRTTAYRTTVALEGRGLIERTDDHYGLTPQGVAIAAIGERYADGLAAADRLEPFLSSVHHPDFVHSLHLFADAEVLTSDRDDPFGLIESLMDRLAAADRFRCMVDVVGPARWFDVAAERAAEGVDIEAVFSRTSLAQLDEDAAASMAKSLRLPTCDVFVLDDIPFALNTFDESVIVVGEDEDTGIPNSCVVTDRRDAWEWAESLFRRYRRAAEPIEAEDLVA